MDKVRIGTSGWSYKDWLGSFYPPGTTAKDYLASYATHFPAVEVDSTYYGIPRGETVKKWADSTPDGFRFTLKVPREVTHGASSERPKLDGVLRDEEGVLERFLDTVEALGDKLGAVLFQFPYFRVKEMVAEDFLARLAAVLSGVRGTIRCAVEVRNKGWIQKPFLDLLRSHRVAAVMIDHPYLPGPLQQLRLGMVTTDFAYVRLLGDRYGIEKITRSWGETVVNRDSGLSEWAALIHQVAEMADVQDLYSFSNNHYAGHAPATCRSLVKMVGGHDFPA